MALHAPKIPETRQTLQAQQTTSTAGISSFTDLRPEATVQRKMQKLADNRPAQFRAVQSAVPVVQRVKQVASDKKERFYKEKKIKIIKKKKTTYQEKLTKIGRTQYNASKKNDPVTMEEGYERFSFDPPEDQHDWDLNKNVVDVDGGQIKKVGTFQLPVSCIEAAEHIIHHAKIGAIPDWNNDPKSVDLYLNDTTSNQKVLNLHTDIVDRTSVKPFTSFDFSAENIAVNEGLLMIRKTKAGYGVPRSMHVIVVVGKNKTTGQIIALERNAGATNGGTEYLDADWLLNVYDSPEAFRLTGGPDFIVGKLKAT